MPELAAIREALIGRARELGYPAGGDCGAYLTGDRTGTGD